MIKRTIEISRHPAHLAVKLDQLRILRHTEDESAPLQASIPCEDIGVVLVDHPASTYSHQALAKLAEFGAAVVICGRNHLPAALMLPLPGHSEVAARIRDQAQCSKPRRKQLWKQLVAAKVRAQARNLPPCSPARRRLEILARRVRSGDPTNIEAQAARAYWSAWLQLPRPSGDIAGAGESNPPRADDAASAFRRDPDGDDPLNSMLNYGYAVLRAAVGRAIVAAGLTPALGIHHRHRANSFCLADDLLEPLRPIADARVRRLHRAGSRQLDRPTKAALLELLTVTVRTGGSEADTGSLMVHLHRYVASLIRCLTGEDKRLRVPVIADPAPGSPVPAPGSGGGPPATTSGGGLGPGEDADDA